MKEPLVVYIIGDNRSGSTLLDYLLSCHPQIISVGELHNLHRFYYEKNIGNGQERRCSCGKHIDKCEYWSEILEKVPNAPKLISKKGNRPNHNLLTPFKQRMFFNKELENKGIRKNGEAFATSCWDVYHAIARETKRNIIIDSSKNIFEANYLYKFRKGEIRFLFLNRSIYEVALSKKKHSTRDQKMNLFERLKHPIYRYIWHSYLIMQQNNLFKKHIERTATKKIFKKIEYIALTKDPQKTIKELCDFLNIIDFDVPNMTNSYKETPHIIGGSPSRYKKQIIKPDKRWKEFYRNRPIALNFARFLQRL